MVKSGFVLRTDIRHPLALGLEPVSGSTCRVAAAPEAGSTHSSRQLKTLVYSLFVIPAQAGIHVAEITGSRHSPG